MAEDKDVSTRPFQLRPSILSGGGTGFGSVFGSGGPNDASNKKFILRPSTLSSAADNVLAPDKPELGKRRKLEDDDKANEKDKEIDTSKKAKVEEEDDNNQPSIKLTEDLQKPTGIGTFGFSQKSSSVNSSSNKNGNSNAKTFPNYFAQNPEDKVSFVFGNKTNNSTTGSFGAIKDENVENKTKDNGVTENGSEDEQKEVETVIDKDRLLENANEYQKSHDEKRLHFEEVDHKTGEEGEKHVLQIICKLHLFDKENKTWLERGRGTLKLNDLCQSEGLFQSRLVFRMQGTNIVQLNTKLWPDMSCEKLKDKSIRITAIDPDTKDIKVFLISTNIKDCMQTFTAIHRRVEALRRYRDQQKELGHDLDGAEKENALENEDYPAELQSENVPEDDEVTCE